MIGASTAIAGVGATDFSSDSGRSELQLALEAILAALEDAGVSPEDVDGMVTYTLDTSPEWEIARNMGTGPLTFFNRVPHGGGAACGTIAQAVMAVKSGAASTVVCYRAFNERSGRRFGIGPQEGNAPTAEMVHLGWHRPYGHLSAGSWVGMYARRYMAKYGATSADFGRVTVAMRQWAATNPAARFFERPLTLEEHQASRWIAEPLRLLDCCLESDGGVAFVVTSLERARDLRKPPVVVSSVGQISAPGQERMTGYYLRDDLTRLPEVEMLGGQLWRESGRSRSDVDVAVVYDHFTPMVLMQLEALGFCAPGEAAAFVADGHLGRDGSLPTNPNGGQLGEAYIHGMNGIAEAARQVRGESVNQVASVETALVTSGTGVPTSAMILTADTDRP
ncbi:MAG: lipid-transfer protein [Frankiales bacterium]|nr:lipid-transfer protein [Frankiales bacterium]